MGQPAQRITLIAPDDVATAVYRLTKNQSLARAVANSAAMVMRDDIIDAVKVEKGMIGLEEYALAAHRRRQHANQVIASSGLARCQSAPGLRGLRRILT